ncbi:MAG: serpin family protein [Acidimicrobiales bacterium]
MRRRTLIAIGTVLALAVAACGDDEGGGSSPPAPGGGAMPAGEILDVRSDLERQEPSGPTDVSSVVASDTAFAWELFGELTAVDPEANLFVSPYSVSVALSLLLPGARGETAEEIASVLQAPDDESWHQGRNALDHLLMAQRPTIEPLQPLELSVVNSVWGQAGYPFEDAYLDTLARHYGAGLNSVDFVTDWDAARQAINEWVESETNDRIVDLVPDEAIDDQTRMVLVNAIFFKANWLHPFDPDQTTDGPFTLLDGSTATVPTMRQSIRTDYGEGDGWQAVRLPYAGDASMVVIAPEEGRFTEVVGALDADRIGQVRARLGDHQVQLSMPRFEVRSTLSLVEALRSLGMVEAFVRPGADSGADLTGITAVRELFVTEAVHQAWVIVDEEGTEAAAATALMIGRTSMPPPATLTLDRPFVFLIQDDATGSILFVGQVTDPTAG